MIHGPLSSFVIKSDRLQHGCSPCPSAMLHEIDTILHICVWSTWDLCMNHNSNVHFYQWTLWHNDILRCNLHHLLYYVSTACIWCHLWIIHIYRAIIWPHCFSEYVRLEILSYSLVSFLKWWFFLNVHVLTAQNLPSNALKFWTSLLSIFTYSLVIFVSLTLISISLSLTHTHTFR